MPRPAPIVFALRTEYIQLDQLLKTTGLVHSGGAAHMAVDEGLVRVDGQPESRKRAKIRAGQVVTFSGATVKVVASTD